MREYLRSYLYVPGNRGDLLAKVFTRGADAVVIDLEDAVPAAEKQTARDTARAVLATRPPIPVYVRLNAGEAALEDAAAIPADASGLRIPKAEDPEIVRRLAGMLDAKGPQAAAVEIHPLIESAAGLFNLDALAAASRRVTRFIFGAGDFVHDIGAEKTASRSETLFARSLLVARSRYLGLAAPIAHVFSPIADLDGLADASRADRAMGFFGRSCIHPSQIDVVHRSFGFSPREIAQARFIVDGYAMATAEGRGSALLADGTFVDEAVAKRARRILDIAGKQTDQIASGDSFDE
jgi:citrate lyase subunit beta/citryl-CoA lyase